MKLIAVSDVHGKYDILQKLCLLHKDADSILFLGDGCNEVSRIRLQFPEIPMIAVRGNCDFACLEPVTRTLQLDDMRIFMTHGHIYSVKSTLAPLEKAALEQKANIVLFGHTHIPICRYSEGVWLANPGSLGIPRDGVSRYVVINTTPTGPYCHLAELK